MQLDADDLDLVRQIADYHAFLNAPRTPLLSGDLRGVLRRMNQARADLARMELQWLNRGLRAAGLPTRPEWTSELLPGVAQRVPEKTYVPAQATVKALEIPPLHK